MRVYFPHDPRISRAMERIRQAFIRHAPPGTEFLQKPEPDSVHVINWVSQNPREHHVRDEQLQAAPTLPLTPRFIVLLHMGNWFWPQHQAEFQALMKRAMLVVTFNRELLGFEGPEILETPWGYDPQIFFWSQAEKRFTILATGYVADSEAIDAIADACYQAKLSVVHVGGHLHLYYVGPTYTRFEGIPDDQLRQLYQQSRFVSGMRREGGFELPAIEGYACGAQPIVFDNSTTRKHYSDFALFVPNLARVDLARVLVPLLQQPLNLTPKPEILTRFHWSTVMSRVWGRILECLK